MKWVVRILLVTSMLFVGQFSRAQGPQQQWDNLKTLRSGEKIELVDQKLGLHKGTLVNVSEDTISVKTKRDVITLPREDVLRVTAQERGHGRGLYAVIGFAAGAAVGAALGAQEAGNPDWPAGAAGAGIGMAILGPIGLGVGAAIPPRRPTIYRAERRVDQKTP